MTNQAWDEDMKQEPPIDDKACHSMPDLTRLRYFHGQLLGAHDFQTEQDYFREKLKLLNRCLQGYGTVCGLKVVKPKPEHKCGESAESEASSEVWIECGFALDCEGNELIVHHPISLNLKEEIGLEQWKNITTDNNVEMYLSICYCVQGIYPVKPLIPDACGAQPECIYSRLRDTVKVKVSEQKTCEHPCRDNCCEKCADKCLQLARIEILNGEIKAIHNDERRWISLYEPTVITGISWIHGADNYTKGHASHMLHHHGLIIEFSRPILPETVTKGVLDVIVLEGGSGRHADIYYIDGKTNVDDTKDSNGKVIVENNRIVFQQTSREGLEEGDRVLIVLRTDFILDECCQPIDGNHIGGYVPLLHDCHKSHAEMLPQDEIKHSRKCFLPPHRYGRWTSGNGTPGGTFESWFYIKCEEEQPEEAN